MDARVAAEALSWIGTPYRHQASAKGIGCDCLGLVKGVWRALYGCELGAPQDYAPDWASVDTRDVMLAGARHHFEACGADAPLSGRLLIFRWRPHLPARHAGIAVAEDRFVHAYEGGGQVVLSALVPQWRRRIAGVFAFPQT
ncbi:NlpC/P60 family protein [Aquamicrobium terrae]|uniref:NlpC/P60 family putative phage cell wall peptidase n=1 Tax=Aquamicrobium terrae TaxID=1324945 RepID=A0ABV2MVD7_9HYPH